MDDIAERRTVRDLPNLLLSLIFWTQVCESEAHLTEPIWTLLGWRIATDPARAASRSLRQRLLTMRHLASALRLGSTHWLIAGLTPLKAP